MPSICRNCPVDTFAKSLVNSSPGLMTALLKHFRPDIADMIRDMVGKHGALPASEIELAREKILAIVDKSIAK